MEENQITHPAWFTPAQMSRRAALRRVAGMGAAVSMASVLAQTGTTGAIAGGITPISANSVIQGGHMNQSQSTPAQATPAGGTTPTVVLVHGAFADGSSWAGVISLLQKAGISVVAPANPLRSLAGDAAYVASVVNQISGPVILVGHSYGGAVITNAAGTTKNVRGLVYVAALIPDQGESLQTLAGQAKDSLLGPALRPSQYPTGANGKSGTEFSIDPASFQAVFCADLPTEQAAVLAATQRPAADLAFGEPTQNPAWKTLPSWAIVGTADKAIGITGSRLMAKRAGAITVETDASHVVMLSQPTKVADLIRTALGSLT